MVYNIQNAQYCVLQTLLYFFIDLVVILSVKEKILRKVRRFPSNGSIYISKSNICLNLIVGSEQLDYLTKKQNWHIAYESNFL